MVTKMLTNISALVIENGLVYFSVIFTFVHEPAGRSLHRLFLSISQATHKMKEKRGNGDRRTVVDISGDRRRDKC